MIYFDNGATTFPKPVSVINSINTANKRFGANPGRGGHKLAIKASELVYNARKVTAEFFGVSNPEKVIFSLNCTTAINTVIKGLLNPGDHVIISSLEHNAVLRPLDKLKAKGITYSVAQVIEGDNDETLSNFRNAINEKTKLLVCTYASNVVGIKLPVERICSMCHQYGILCCVDAAQSAGTVPIDLSDSSIDYLCVSGHKGLYGPMGIGALIINCDVIPDSLIEGGTGSNSIDYAQPLILPDKFESGTNNFSGIIGMGEGIKFVSSYGQMKIYKKEIDLLRHIYDKLKLMKKIELYTQRPNIDYYVPVLSFNVKGKNSEEVADELSSKYNIAVRAGLHCAPLAHKSIGTLNTGTVRVVPSVFTTNYDINSLISAVYKII